MAKWYVQSGQVQGIVIADTPEAACQQIICRGRVDVGYLSVITTVSETGFTLTEDTIVMLTKHLLREPHGI